MNTLSSAQLIDYFAQGCKPKQQWRLGVEHEKIGFYHHDHTPIPYEGKHGIGQLLNNMANQSHWQAIMEGEHIIGLRHGLASVTLEPGGQLELSGAPLQDIFAIQAELDEHLELLEHASQGMGIGFLTTGFNPLHKRQDIPWMPKSRYDIMKAYMPKVGNLGLDMMLRTATVQVNLDYESEADMAKKMRVSCCLQPLVTALFAASPFYQGKPNGMQSNRAACWQDTDAQRTGIPACVFDDHFGFAAYAEWALSVPMYFINRQGRFIDCSGSSFEDFIAGKLSAAAGEKANINDWELHLSTLFPEVRLKTFLEMRGADSSSSPWICALPALWKGLLYHPESLQAAYTYIADWSQQELEDLLLEVPKNGIHSRFRKQNLQQPCLHILELAEQGLQTLSQEHNTDDESDFLEPLWLVAKSKQSQADLLIAQFYKDWQQSLSPMFEQEKHY